MRLANNLVIFHASCADGFTSAWIARLELGESATYTPVRYGQPMPDVSGFDNVYILDFSYSQEEIMEASDKVHHITILDHHKTAEKNLAGLVEYIKGNDDCNVTVEFDMNRCGATMTWDHFNPGEERPLFVEYIQDNDLWTHALPDTLAVGAYMRTVPMEFDAWGFTASMLATERGKESIVESGNAVLAAQAIQVKSCVKHRHKIKLGDHVLLAVNSPYYQSEIGHALAEDAPAGVVYFFNEEGMVVISLRSTSEYSGHLDVSELAASYGGGGHKHASGMTLSMPDFFAAIKACEGDA